MPIIIIAVVNTFKYIHFLYVYYLIANHCMILIVLN